MLIPKYLSIGACALVMQGCSVTTFLGGFEQAKPIYVLNVPPNRIGWGGHLNEEDRKLLLEMTKRMLDKPYKNFHYPYGSGVKTINETKISTSHSFSGTTAVKGKGRL